MGFEGGDQCLRPTARFGPPNKLLLTNCSPLLRFFPGFAAFLLTVGSFLLTVELFQLQLTILGFLLTI